MFTHYNLSFQWQKSMKRENAIEMLLKCLLIIIIIYHFNSIFSFHTFARDKKSTK